MKHPCLYCIYNTKRCTPAKEAQETGYCKWISYYPSEEEQIE